MEYRVQQKAEGSTQVSIVKIFCASGGINVLSIRLLGERRVHKQSRGVNWPSLFLWRQFKVKIGTNRCSIYLHAGAGNLMFSGVLHMIQILFRLLDEYCMLTLVYFETG